MIGVSSLLVLIEIDYQYKIDRKAELIWERMNKISDNVYVLVENVSHRPLMLLKQTT